VPERLTEYSSVHALPWVARFDQYSHRPLPRPTVSKIALGGSFDTNQKCRFDLDLNFALMVHWLKSSFEKGYGND